MPNRTNTGKKVLVLLTCMMVAFAIAKVCAVISEKVLFSPNAIGDPTSPDNSRLNEEGEVNGAGVDLTIHTITRRIQAGKLDSIAVTVGGVDLTINTHGAPEVLIEATLAAESQAAAEDALRVESTDTALTVKHTDKRFPSDKFDLGALWAALKDSPFKPRQAMTVWLPSTMTGDLRFKTGAGILDLATVPASRKLTAAAGAGNLFGENLQAGEAHISTGAGQLELNGLQITGNLHVATGAGKVEAHTISATQSTFMTGTGRIDIRDLAGAATFNSGVGSINVAAVGSSSPIKCKSATGTIELKLPDEASVELDLNTRVGSVRVRHPRADSQSSGRTSYRGRIGSGGPLVQLSTEVGSIRVK